MLPAARAISLISGARRSFASGHFVAVVLLAAAIPAASPSSGQTPEVPPALPGEAAVLREPPLLHGPIFDGPTMPPPASDQLLRLIASLVRENIPEHYENNKDWDLRKKVYAGVKLRRDGWRIKTKRRWKSAKHGRWRRFRVDLIDPDKRLEVRLSNFRWVAENRFHVRLMILADLELFARQARWNYDVQLYSLHVDAHARVQMEVDATVGFHLDPSEVPPALVVAPVVERAELDLRRFEVDRISHIRGDVAKELGNAAEGLIRREIVDRRSAKLADRMNRQIERHRDDLRISIADWLTEWLASD